MNKNKIRSLSSSQEKKEKNIIKTQNSYFNNYKKDSDVLLNKIKKANQKKIIEIQQRNNKIDALNNEIRELKLNNYNLKRNSSQKLLRRKSINKTQNEMGNYCTRVMRRYIYLSDTKNEYENCIKKLKDDYEKISNEYDKKISQVEEININISNNIKDKMELYNKQNKEICDRKKIIQILQKKNDDQEKMNINREKYYKEKYEKLKYQYQILEEKIYTLFSTLQESGHQIKMKKLINKYNKLYKLTKNKKKKNNNNELIEQIGELKKKIGVINKRYSSSEDLLYDYTKGSKISRGLTSTNFLTEKNSFRTKSIN